MRKLSFLLAAVMLMAIFSGCSTGNVSTPAASSQAVSAVEEKKPAEIVVVTSYGSDDGNRMNYENAISAFEKATGHTVRDISSTSNEAWKQGVMTSFANGMEPDVLFYFTGVDSNKIVEEGKVVSIDEIRLTYPDYASNMRYDMLAKSSVDGKRYAVPVNGYWESMYVNKKVLEDCGVPIPDANTEWKMFLKACETIKAKGYTPIAVSISELPHYWFEFCVFNNGTLETHAQLPTSSEDAIGQNWVAGINDIKYLYDCGFFPENTLTAPDSETSKLMIDNKAAFMIDGSWKMGWFAENAANIDDFTVTYVTGENERKSTEGIGGLSMGYYITKKAWDNPEKRDVCVSFIEAMTTDEVVATFGATSVTALKSGTKPPSNANNLVKDALATINGYTGIVSAAQDGLIPAARADLFDNMKNVVTGKMTAQEAVDHCLAIEP